jgi:peptidyl-tRNA hydrolase
MPDYPVQYILMRSDLDSMNPGKAMAQAAHASTVMTRAFENTPSMPQYDDYVEWVKATKQGFGTCIVLDGKNDAVLDYVTREAIRTGIYAQIIHDPTYPVSDGGVCHLIPVNTCVVLFGMKSQMDAFFGSLMIKLELHS